MSFMDEFGEFHIQRFDSLISVDGKEIKLPADAPEGFPHIIEIPKLAAYMADYGAPDEFSPVDAIATTLYMWKPKALLTLLDLTTSNFSWTRRNMNFDTYINREGTTVTVPIQLHNRLVK